MNNSGESKFMTVVGLLFLLVFVVFVWWWTAPKSVENELLDILPPNGSPVLVMQSRVGDDVTPIIHQTWCQLLPYKRSIADDQVFCYIEVIDDWVVE